MIEAASNQDEYSARQKEVILKKLAKEIDGLWSELRASSEDSYRLLRKLMFDLYAADKSKREMTMMQACDAIPLKHKTHCKKYIEFAKKEELVKFKKHRVDGRKILVLPTRKLLQIVEAEIQEQCRSFDDLATEFKNAAT